MRNPLKVFERIEEGMTTITDAWLLRGWLAASVVAVVILVLVIKYKWQRTALPGHF